jgi:hypothetical protein
MNQKISGRHFDKRTFKTIGVAIFEQPVKFRCFQRIVRMSCKIVFRTEVAQGWASGSIGHKKASRVVKHREAMIIREKMIILGSKI